LPRIICEFDSRYPLQRINKNMAHQQQFDFIQSLVLKFPEQFSDKKVLEVGSLNINGSIRQFFTECDYLGIDVGPGVDVDLVCEG